MSARAKRRAAERVLLNAVMCRVPLTDWVELTRRERRRRLAAARKEVTHD